MEDAFGKPLFPAQAAADAKSINERELVARIRVALDDLNDMLRLAKSMGIGVSFVKSAMTMDPTGAKLDPISLELSKRLS